MTAILKSELTEKELEKALDGCAKEPIHTPGSIQPHGMLFVISEADMVIRQASANTFDFVGQPANALINKPLGHLVGLDQARQLDDIITAGDLQPVKSGLFTIQTATALRTFDVVAHRSEGHLILEMEPAPREESQDSLQQFYDRLRNFSVQLAKTTSLAQLYQIVVDEIRQLSGFDRVKLYQFDEDWHGTVLTESKADFMPSYLGLHFPASDIPEQARILYSKSYLRLIADIDYEPVPIVPTYNPATNQLADLSLSVLRSVSPVHIQYLDNMEVKASMSISVMQNNQLWGLIACHNNSAKHVPYRTRMAAELIGHIFSAHLATLQEAEKSKLAQTQTLLMTGINTALNRSASIKTSLQNCDPLFQELLQADASVYRINQELYCFGQCLPEDKLRGLIEWLEQRQDPEPFITHRLSDSYTLPESLRSIACGLLATPLQNRQQDWALWFRKEATSEINWAGKPEKQVAMDSVGFRLTPRASFALWKESLKSQAKKWTADLPNKANEIAQLLAEKRIKDELRQHEADMETILANSNAFISIKDQQGRYLSVSQSLLNLLEKPAAEVISKTDTQLFPPKVTSKIREQDIQVLQNKRSMTFEETLAGKDLRNRHLITVKFPLYDAEGKIYAVCGISTDITERKENEQVIQQYARDLERSNQELDEFAYIASHDLKEPLRGIHNLAGFLLRDYTSKLDQEGDHKLNRLMDLSKRIHDLVGDLFNYSRIGRGELAIKHTDLNLVINDIQKTLPELEDERVKLNILTPLPDIICDRTRVTELFRNLISNALKYNDSSEKRIDIGWQTDPQNKIPVFFVRDNGIGIADDMRNEIFRIFKRLHKTGSYGGGTGSGLTFVKKIVERHQGRIWLESEPSKGSTFFFTLQEEN